MGTTDGDRDLVWAEGRGRAILDAALDAIVTMDADGRVLEFNPAAERTFGYSNSDAVGTEMAELIVPPELREAHRAGLARYLDTQSPTLLDQRIEIEGVRSDGTRIPVELTITRIDVPGPPTFTGHLRDITERRRAEAELADSRARLVRAGDAARRRIERDLHDGAQQRLVGLSLSLGLARSRLEADPEGAAEILDEATAELGEAIDELRDLARGIHPAVLTEGGLAPALRALANRSSVPVEVEAVPAERLAQAVEATAYFVVAEGLTNVSRYSGATRVKVSIEAEAGSLVVEVRDDGAGGADPRAGSGLTGLADRLSALGGGLEVGDGAGGGTILRAVMPCE